MRNAKYKAGVSELAAQTYDVPLLLFVEDFSPMADFEEKERLQKLFKQSYKDYIESSIALKKSDPRLKNVFYQSAEFMNLDPSL